MTLDEMKKNERVIINPNLSKKSAHYVLAELPSGITQDHYEKMVKNPVGRDWNTHTSYTKEIAPSVTVKAGKAIEPLDFATAKQVFPSRKRQKQEQEGQEQQTISGRGSKTKTNNSVKKKVVKK